ncbi:MAG: hypothetical protein AAB583_02855 [Patescibacteria group bacterium]
MNIKSLLILIILGLFYFISPITSYADTTCQPIYGGGQTCISEGNILVDKKVLNPKTKTMVDNLGIDDARFQPESLVTFEVNVTNKSNSTIKKIDVKDIFPQHVTFSSGTGNFDPNTKNLTFSIDNLKSQETKTFTVTGKVVSANQISMEQGVVCVVNQVIATANDNSENKDNVQFCIEKKTAVKGGFPVLTPTQVTITPSTGAESFVLFSLLPTGIVGLLLRKYTYRKLRWKEVNSYV